MNHFGSTFILCFLGFLFIQANAIPSWKACTQSSDCQATEEYCLGGGTGSSSAYCEPCSDWTSSEVDPLPAWCSDLTSSLTLTSSSLLTYVKQAGYKNDAAMCPTFSACQKNCRKEYTVSLNAEQIILASSFTDTTDCVCDKLSFTYTFDEDHFEWLSTSNSFDAGVTSSSISQSYMNTLDLWTEKEDTSGGYEIDCVWEYSIGTVSSPPPPPSPLPPPSPATALTGLLGLVSASVVAFVLV